MTFRNLVAVPKIERWHRKPGNYDRLNTRITFDTDDDLGIPLLRGMTTPPDSLYAYHQPAPPKRSALSAYHFFLDDYRFEQCFNRPEVTLPRIQRMGIACTPDFSLWPEMPLAMQQWQVYRNRWCGAWWEHNGVSVIPTIGWADWKTYSFAFRGVTRGSVVAVSTRGVLLSPDAQRGFMAGFEAMLDHIEPRFVVVYGRPLPAMVTLADCLYFPAKVIISGRTRDGE